MWKTNKEVFVIVDEGRLHAYRFEKHEYHTPGSTYHLIHAIEAIVY